MATLREEIEDADSLDAADEIVVEQLDLRQNELVTAVVDYNLASIADLVGERTIDLSPQYQRRLRWGPKKQSQLIESFLMNVPVPPIYLNEDRYGKYSVIDGKQRLHTIHSFITDRLRLRDLEVFPDLNRKRYSDLPDDFRSFIATRATIRAIVVLRQSSSQIKYEVFWRLNTGGVNLNAQEIRNSAFTGVFNDLIMELCVLKEFHALLRIRESNRSGIYQEMRDAEFVLRYFTFRDQWRDFTGGVQKTLDDYMSVNKDADEAFLDSCHDDFSRTLANVSAVFGEFAFRRWDPRRKHWRDQVLVALIDSQMLACHEFAEIQWRKGRQAFLVEYRKLFQNESFRESIDAATNTPRLLKQRVETTLALMKHHIGSD